MTSTNTSTDMVAPLQNVIAMMIGTAAESNATRVRISTGVGIIEIEDDGAGSRRAEDVLDAFEKSVPDPAGRTARDLLKGRKAIVLSATTPKLGWVTRLDDRDLDEQRRSINANDGDRETRGTTVSLLMQDGEATSIEPAARQAAKHHGIATTMNGRATDATTATEPARPVPTRVDHLRRLHRAITKIPQINENLDRPLAHGAMQLTAPHVPYPTGFSMEYVYAHEKNGCGTAACVAGLTAHEFPVETRLTIDRMDLYGPGVGSQILIRSARKVLELDTGTADALFLGEGSRWEGHLTKLPKAAVLRAIDRVIGGSEGTDIWAPQDR